MDLTTLIINNCLHKFDVNKCHKLTIKDGITTDLFLLPKYADIFDQIEFDSSSMRKNIPSIGYSLSIIKNLDYYQDLICKMIPSLLDSNPLKIALQKLRFLIMAAFSKLSRLIIYMNKNGIDEWNKISKYLLEIVSSTIVSYRSNNQFEDDQLLLDKSDLFKFFDLDVNRINNILKDFYL